MKVKPELFEQLKDAIKTQGLELYANKENIFPASSYGYISDGVRVIYWQGDEFGIGFLFSSKCKPSKKFGTGYCFFDDPIQDIGKMPVDFRGLLDQGQRPAHWLGEDTKKEYRPCILSDVLDGNGFFRIV